MGGLGMTIGTARRFVIALFVGLCLAPLVAAAQQRQPGKVYRVAVLANTTRHLPEFDELRRALHELGYIEGENLVMDWRYAEKGPAQLPELAAELLRRQPDVIVPITTPATLAVKEATSTIPVVFAGVGDPVSVGLVASLARPGWNITGQSNLASQLSAKRLELLHELVPSASLVAVLWNPTNPNVHLQLQETQDAARALGLRLLSLPAEDRRGIEAAFEAATREGAEAVIGLPDNQHHSHRSVIVDLAARTRLPALYIMREYPEIGGLA
jgi:putative ABC transport system substrate-binding protein